MKEQVVDVLLSFLRLQLENENSIRSDSHPHSDKNRQNVCAVQLYT